ncbi:hypothetical protein SASPL_133505 [Salvia splendens]|uniref:NusB/RsmB/TIM44 domain-containing protein n=1 Tax=Salvia splendens TaxID=180675 RepID=A0A8X8ZIE3_SALSN|nr:hypothetical protein SASPL_133505 [Salvia splendens]
MEAGYILSSSFNPPKTLFSSISKISSPHGRRDLPLLPRAATIPLTIHNPIATSASNYPRIDKSGKFCSPRAAQIGYEFDRACLMEYDHMTFGGPPIATQTIEEADQLLKIYQKESHIEAEVLSAPPNLVYSKLILLFTRKLLAAVSDNWDNSVVAIDKVAPDSWKNEPATRILEFSVLHLAMSEIAVLGTRHQIVINEAVDLAKRFCDGAAPRVINGCLRTFLKELKENGQDEPQNVSV